MTFELTATNLAHRLHNSYHCEIRDAIAEKDYVAAGLRIWAYTFWLEEHPDLGRLHCGTGLIDIGRAVAQKLIEGRKPPTQESEMLEAYVAQAQMKPRE